MTRYDCVILHDLHTTLTTLISATPLGLRAIDRIFQRGLGRLLQGAHHVIDIEANNVENAFDILDEFQLHTVTM